MIVGFDIIAIVEFSINAYKISKNLHDVYKISKDIHSVYSYGYELITNKKAKKEDNKYNEITSGLDKVILESKDINKSLNQFSLEFNTFKDEVKYQNELQQELINRNFKEILKISTDIKNIGVNIENVYSELGKISNTLLNISQSIANVERDVDILINTDFKKAMTHIKAYLLIKDLRELEKAQDSLESAYHIYDMRRESEKSKEFFLQYALAAYYLISTYSQLALDKDKSYIQMAKSKLNILIDNTKETEYLDDILDFIKLSYLSYRDIEQDSQIERFLVDRYVDKTLKYLDNLELDRAKKEIITLNDTFSDKKALVLQENIAVLLDRADEIKNSHSIAQQFIKKHSKYIEFFNGVKSKKIAPHIVTEYIKEYRSEFLIKESFKFFVSEGLILKAKELLQDFYIDDKDFRAKGFLLVEHKLNNNTKTEKLLNLISELNYSDDTKSLAKKIGG